MKLLESKKFTIPKVFLVTDRKDLSKIPIGVPFIFGDSDIENYLIRLLEYEVLYQNAVKSGYPFNFKQILKDAGYLDLADFGFDNPTFVDFKTKKGYDEDSVLEDSMSVLGKDPSRFKDFVRDSSCYVDIEKLKALNVFPTWLDTIEKAIETNIHNFAMFNHNMYNKKLEGMYGGIELQSPNKNLIIIDISGSIPRAVSVTCLNLAKNLMQSFYSDLLITGSKSTLYQYENIHELDVTKVYSENGQDNDQVWFKKLVTQEKRIYKTAIVFGDNHHPGFCWRNTYNKGSRLISDEDGQKLCVWEVDNLISLHVKGTDHIAGYSRWFRPKKEERIPNWVKSLQD